MHCTSWRVQAVAAAVQHSCQQCWHLLLLLLLLWWV
jgi:hypothetical protein